jgi:hypothetical protein
MMTPEFTCLYFLENTTIYIIEVKRIDSPENFPIAQRIKWLRIDKETLAITELTFSAMDSAGDIEERYFEQGYLKFNQNEGTYIEKYNSAQHPLFRRMVYRMSTPLKNVISDFLINN